MIIQNALALIFRWKWVFLGITGWLVHLLLNLSPEIADRFYSRGLFRLIRWIFSHSLAFLPFPAFYLFAFLLIFLIFRFIRFLFTPKTTWRNKWGHAFFLFASFLGALVFFFYFLWGYNYSRTPFDRQIGLQRQELDSATLKKELEDAASDVVAAKKAAEAYGPPPTAFFNNLPEFMRAYATRTLNQYGFPAGGNLRGRLLRPDGVLYRFGSSGVYLPWVGESNIDDAIHPLQKPFIMAHELAHGYGWGDEGTCNFIAYLTCRQSSNPYVRYSGYLDYYRYVASNYRIDHQKEYERFRTTLPIGVRTDLEEINQTISQYPEWISFNFIYEWYLKGNGMPEGMQSYNKVISLVYNYRLAQANK